MSYNELFVTVYQNYSHSSEAVFTSKLSILESCMQVEASIQSRPVLSMLINAPQVLMYKNSVQRLGKLILFIK